MKKLLGYIAVTTLVFSPILAAAEGKVPAGKENLILDSTSKAKEAAGKKVMRGPVPFAHQAHVDQGVTCVECHHKQPEGETPKPCHACHHLLKTEAPKESDAFHCGSVESMPALQSCIGCHSRKVAGKKVTNAPVTREPCTTCHSILNK